MSKKFALLNSAAVLAVLAGAGSAEAAGYYLSFHGGANNTNDLRGLTGGGGVLNNALSTTVAGYFGATDILHFSFTANTAFTLDKTKAETGFVVGVAVGKDLSAILPGLRGELEASFRNNTLRNAHLRANATDVDTDTATLPSTTSNLVFYPQGVVTPLIGSPFPFFGGLPQFITGTTQVPFAATFNSTRNEQNDGAVRTFALMANVWYDFDMESWIKPYVGGGVGYAQSVVEASNMFKGDDGNFAWQLGAGVNLSIDATTSINVGYRYLDGGSVEVDVPLLAGGKKSFDHDVTHKSVTAGITFKLE
ncbi:MAG: porin family protein [Alphaproteobacteria bacterium]|nr:porin family protein [Alphaproteobacteria bacterium]